MKRRTFLSTLGAGLAAGLGAPRAIAAVTPHPNILWLVSEDTSPDLGCYGNPLVHTPHLDRLAEQGARYDAALATCPV